MHLPLLRPFAGMRPVSKHVSEVAAPPYDVLNSEEARLRAEGKEWCFLHVSKPEIDLPPGTDVHAEEVYAKGADNFWRMIETGVLMRDPSPCYYVYRLTMGGHSQTGLVAAASIPAYEENRIRKHEFTRPDKEDDRVKHMEALNCQTGPVMLAHQPNAKADNIIALACALPPDVEVAGDNGVTHVLWVVSKPQWIEALSAAFEDVEALYIADGHHRSAAAARVAAAKRDANPMHLGNESYNSFLVVTFPKDEMQILDYNRLVRDLNGLTAKGLMERLVVNFTIKDFDGPARPQARGQFGLYLEGQWHRLTLRHQPPESVSPVEKLDISLLTSLVLEPILGIGDPRTDPRIDFVGGMRGLEELARRVDSGEMAVAFALYATSMDDLMAVAEAGQVMPPKSTWFEPKLADGLVCHMLG